MRPNWNSFPVGKRTKHTILVRVFTWQEFLRALKAGRQWILMNNETYLNHPTFGLLYRVCLVAENEELYTTLYAQRLFFLVTGGGKGIRFTPISRSDARLLVENRLRLLRRQALSTEYEEVYGIYQQTFQ